MYFQLQVQPKYPQVVELVARKVESLRLENSKQKVLTWDEMRKLVREEINGLVSERQLGFICKVLADAGVVSITVFIIVVPCGVMVSYT